MQHLFRLEGLGVSVSQKPCGEQEHWLLVPIDEHASHASSGPMHTRPCTLVQQHSGFFFSCIAERARDMVGQKQKKSETGIACRSSFTGKEAETTKKNKTKKPTTRNTTHKKQLVKILAKKMKPTPHLQLL